MKIIIKESHVAVLRRLSEIGQIINEVISKLNDDIKGRFVNKPDNFGVYEAWVINRLKDVVGRKYSKIDFNRYDFLMLVGGQYNEEIRNGFNKVKKRR
jgi:hypothetical protein